MQKNINNLKINYFVSGEGRPLFVLHGWGADLTRFWEFQNIFSQKGYRIYLLDLPGFGQSADPPSAWNVADYANLVLKFAQSEKIEKFFLLGHSFGGRISIKLAAIRPEKLLGLILCASAGLKHHKSLKQIIFFIMAKMGDFIFSLPLVKKLKKLAVKVLYFLAKEHDYERAKRVMKDTFKKVISEDLRPFLAQIKVPTLLIWGTEDKLTPLADGKLMASRIPNAQLEIIAGANHQVPYNYLEQTTPIIHNFLEQN